MTPDTLWLPTAHSGLTRLDSEVWMTRDAVGELRAVRLEDMTPGHRVRLLDWLRRHARFMQLHEAEWLRELFLNRTICWEDYAPRRDVLDNVPAVIWIEDTALVRRLHELIRRDGCDPNRGWRG